MTASDESRKLAQAQLAVELPHLQESIDRLDFLGHRDLAGKVRGARLAIESRIRDLDIEDTAEERVARKLWELASRISEEDSDEVAFDLEDWRTLLIPSERETFRVAARELLASAEEEFRGQPG